MSERPNDSPGELSDEIEPGDLDDPDLVEGAEDEWSDEEIAGASAAGAEAAGAERRPMRPDERRAHRAGLEGSKLQVDPSTRITDRASSIFVLLTVAVFVLIFLNGMVLGRGGFLTPIPTPSPVPSITAAPSASPAPSISAAPTAAPTVTPAPTATPAPSASPAPSGSPAPSAS